MLYYVPKHVANPRDIISKINVLTVFLQKLIVGQLLQIFTASLMEPEGL
jgi:hypothetical protein